MESLILIILIIIPGSWSGNWRVTSGDQCALKGSSVVIKCEYDYPLDHMVTAVGWSKTLYVSGKRRRFLLSRLPSPPEHFVYVGDRWSDCSLQINDVQHIDKGAYFFTFETTLNTWTSKASARLSVRELTTVVEPSTVTEGDNVRLTCVSGCPTPINIVWFRDGQRVSNSVFQAGREDAGSYYCAALGQETVRSASVALNVQYLPENISISMDPPHVVEGSSVNLTCSSAANPAAHSYTWYSQGIASSVSSMLQVGSGQVLSLPSVDASHTGLYLCQAANQLGENNSTEVLLVIKRKNPDGLSLLILAGIGLSVLVTLVLTLLLFWLKQRTRAENKAVYDSRLSGRGLSSLDPSDSVNANIYMLPPSTPSSPPPVTATQDSAPHSQRKSHHEHDDPPAYEDEVTYSTVTITPRNPSLPHHMNNSRVLRDSWSKAGENDDSVIYASVAKSS
ncbi:B-cell receptor CD22-like isoform X2 [Cottoperca gobio]|uniref:B-cell receptor CD22-like isoform X2 n=1 Tax=Cottoperca gobio TaxID=56716 RepID=A0A6J2R7L7_COTGO|nr:B-cell receptor CD22-like isoform X2 [Cottoperca gobio]